MILSAPDKELSGQENRINKIDIEGEHKTRIDLDILYKILSILHHSLCVYDMFLRETVCDKHIGDLGCELFCDFWCYFYRVRVPCSQCWGEVFSPSYNVDRL